MNVYYAKAYTWDGMRNLKRSLQSQGYHVRVEREPDHGGWILTYTLVPKTRKA